MSGMGWDGMGWYAMGGTILRLFLFAHCSYVTLLMMLATFEKQKRKAAFLIPLNVLLTSPWQPNAIRHFVT